MYSVVGLGRVHQPQNLHSQAPVSVVQKEID